MKTKKRNVMELALNIFIMIITLCIIILVLLTAFASLDRQAKFCQNKTGWQHYNGSLFVEEKYINCSDYYAIRTVNVSEAG